MDTIKAWIIANKSKVIAVAAVLVMLFVAYFGGFIQGCSCAK